MLFTRCILETPLAGPKGFRISVMSRHTTENGVTLDPRITKDLYDAHLPILGPSPKLIGDYYHRDLSWKDFEKRYLEEIRSPEKAGVVQLLAHLATLKNVILMCIEGLPDLCHRRLLANECIFYEPRLKIEHL